MADAQRDLRLVVGTVLAFAAVQLAGCSKEWSGLAAAVTPGSDGKQLTTEQVAKACADLQKLELKDVAIADASPQAFSEHRGQGPGAPVVRVDVPNCQVTGTIDGSIKFELLLPDTWNGKFLMGGGGGFVGSVQNQAQEGLSAGPTPLERGYATAGTDTGHTGEVIDASWALGNPQARENFAHRAVHRTAEVSKSLIMEYYAERPAQSYFVGCSRGGGQGMIEAERYPEDFDGIVAGAPIYDWPGTTAAYLNEEQAIFPDPSDTSSPVITPDNRKLLADAILQACDMLDGVSDGVLRDPRSCKFDPGTLPMCTDEPKADCLTEPQLSAIRRVYRGPIADGQKLYPGFPFGGENDSQGWDLWITQTKPPALPSGVPNLHFAFGTQFAKYFVYDDPDWTYANLDLSDWRNRTHDVAELLNATNPDLSKFRDRGGKLILWHGWSDSALSALTSLDYHDAVQRKDKMLGAYFRMFMLPGVEHCGGGPGADRVDWIASLEQWVEKDMPPEAITATKTDAAGGNALERKLCPYPQAATLRESGGVDAAASYSCAVLATDQGGAPRSN